MVDQAQMRIGLYGGSFDPPTLAHKQVLNRALEYCDILHVAVTQNNYFKKDQTDFGHRWEMTKVMIGDDISNDRIVLEVGDEYTMTTAHRILRKYEEMNEEVDKLLLIFGADIIEQIPRWRGYETLTSSPMYDLLFLGRYGDISSTVIRGYIHRQSPECFDDTSKLEEWADPKVIGYIRMAGLYRDYHNGGKR